MKIHLNVSPAGVDHGINITGLTSNEFDSLRIVLLTLAQHSSVIGSMPAGDLGLSTVMPAVTNNVKK